MDTEYLSTQIRELIESKSPIGTMMRMALDTAADQYVAEEYHQRFPEVMEFLVKAGSDQEELLWRYYISTHKELLKCKNKDCEGELVGDCPAMWCNECNKKYYLSVEEYTEKMCSRCAAQHLGECIEAERKKRYVIYAVK